MKKLIYRFTLIFFISLIILILFLSTIGVKTDKFNSKIQSQIQQIDTKIGLRLNEVSMRLDLLNLGINLKTIGTDVIYSGKIIKIETIKSKISLKSLLDKTFFLKNISISTKSLVIKDLIFFLRKLNNDPKLFIAEKLIKKGYVVADLDLDFDKSGKIKKNYKFRGLVKEGEINLFNNYLSKIDFIFEVDEKNIKFNDIKITLNNNNIIIPKLLAVKQNDEYLISGNLNTNNTLIEKDEIYNFVKDDLLKFNVKKILFSSKNIFQFNMNKNFKIKNLDIKSDIDIDILELENFLKLKSIFPKIKKEIIFENQSLKIEYKKKNYKIIGSGDVFLQHEKDQIEYEIYKKKDEVKFRAKLLISKNPIKIDLINFKKNKGSNLELNFIGEKYIKNKFFIKEISLKEKDNNIFIKNLILSNDNKIYSLDNMNFNFIDDDGLKNNLDIKKKDNDYFISGNSFNIKSIIDEILEPKNDKKSKLFEKNFKINFDVKSIYLDKNNEIKKLQGFLILNKNDISELNLNSIFSDNQNIKLTIKNNNNEKVTTLYSFKAKPFVDRYKFIKGFEEGDLNFYSVKKDNITSSNLAIDNFKVQEIPVLAKLLTLASLQGIADLLTGEGIRFTDFEMKFSNKGKLMTIEELYAIGPAISILLEGYIQSKELISLRGTLVPATTVNRTISSIPLIGDILVGNKVGEGVFGVSFKIKGPAENLETTVNPIKTLTPRFITRTLEKLKKN